MNHLHWKVVAGKLDKDKGHYEDFIDIHVIASDEKEAIRKAKAIVKKPDYAVKDVRECFAPDTPELQEELLKFMRSQNHQDPWEDNDQEHR